MRKAGLAKILLSLCITFSSLYSFSQRNIIEFDRISIEQGLSQSTIFCILQDHKGYMWFGTEDGLNRYDGYGFTVFNNDITKPNSLNNNRVIDLLEDKNHTLWVATIGGGLNKFDYSTETFTKYTHNPNDKSSLSNDRVMALCEDPSGKIWVGTADGGFNLFNPQTGKFEVFMNTPENPNFIPDNVIRSLHVDSKGLLWVGTNNGICTFDYKTKKVSPVSVKTNDGKDFNITIARKIFEDASGNIWIGTDNQGVVCYLSEKKQFVVYKNEPHSNSLAHNSVYDIYQDERLSYWFATYGGLQKFSPVTNEFETFTNNLSDPKSISSNLVRAIYEDNMGVVWVGTYNDGINKFSQKFKKFEVYRNQANRPLGIAPSTVRSFCEDSEGFIWIATYGSGLLKFDYHNQHFKQFLNNPAKSISLPSDNVTCVVVDFHGQLWVGTTNGLCVFNEKNGTCRVFKENSLKPGSMINSNVRTLYVDSNNDVWIGSSGGGLMRYNRELDSFTSFMPDINNPETSISQDRVLSIYEDNKGNFWVGTSGEGLNLMNRNTGEFKHFKKSTGSNSISSNRILSIFQDSNNRLWVGTGGGGLNLYNYIDQSFESFHTSNGLPNDVIYGIVESNDSTLWISTNNGISNFDPNISPFKFRNYSKADGLQNNEFSEGSYMKSSDGLIYFGGINGFNIIDPSKLRNNPIPPNVYITKARVEEKGNNIPDDSYEIQLHENKSIVLPYTQNNITFYFTALHFISPENNRYKYKLEKFESSWNEQSSNLRFARYTNLRPGKYVFKVIASNSDGVWCNEGDEVFVTIKPPFWFTWWFIASAVLLAGVIVAALVSFREARLLRTKRELEEMVLERTMEITRQNEEMSQQADRIKKANEEIIITSQALAKQNKEMQLKHEEIISQHNELEEQRNSLANLAWELQDKNEEITNQRNEIEHQRDLLTSQKKEITDSIMYAKRIQQAILPTHEQVKECFSEFFVFYRPKSIVSGDFYWVSKIGNYRIIAVADCTGHGVPGGFMSMLGNMLLNEAIIQKQIFDPAKVLDLLRANIITILHQKGQIEDAGDGMDISLCIINDDDKSLTYSGAFSSLFILESTDEQVPNLVEVRSDRMPISYHLVMRPFTNSYFKLKSNTTLYFYTDGLTDQFGGKKGKKFQISRFKDFVLENHNLALKEQGIALEDEFDRWKGNYFQVDDVLVMGIRV